MSENSIQKCKFNFNEGDDPEMSCAKKNPECKNYIEGKQLGTCINPLKSTPLTTAVDLESFKLEYQNVLKEYKKAQQEYINSVKSENPCADYNSFTTGNNISQACYQSIWNKAGCTTKAPTLSNWSNNLNLQSLILNSYNWAIGSFGSVNGTNWNDESGQNTCYGSYIKPYRLFATGSKYGTTNTNPNYIIGDLWV